MSQTESLDRATSTPTTSRSWWWFAAAALVVGHWPVAVGEALIGDLDAVDDLAAINDAAGQVVLAGLMHLLGGFVLAGVAMGVVLVVQRRGAALARVGGILGLLAAVSAGGFAMFHLLLVEYAHKELDGAAISELAATRGWSATRGRASTTAGSCTASSGSPTTGRSLPATGWSRPCTWTASAAP